MIDVCGLTGIFNSRSYVGYLFKYTINSTAKPALLLTTETQISSRADTSYLSYPFLLVPRARVCVYVREICSRPLRTSLVPSRKERKYQFLKGWQRTCKPSRNGGSMDTTSYELVSLQLHKKKYSFNNQLSAGLTAWI
ncbi:unnamed protein product [Pieris macdunnoughi]|uniref:Uncharacterized protein n=1 Tax=Pieris macdunnoughi TaxID=345717 RepID=A0A821VCX7_9NEOP|nr:unnamed protein product [Pieris macdunnoughi]